MLIFVRIYSLSVFFVLRVLPISSVAFLTLKLQPDFCLSGWIFTTLLLHGDAHILFIVTLSIYPFFYLFSSPVPKAPGELIGYAVVCRRRRRHRRLSGVNTLTRYLLYSHWAMWPKFYLCHLWAGGLKIYVFFFFFFFLFFFLELAL